VLEYSGLLKDRTSRLFTIAGELCAVPDIGTSLPSPPPSLPPFYSRLFNAYKNLSIYLSYLPSLPPSLQPPTPSPRK